MKGEGPVRISTTRGGQNRERRLSITPALKRFKFERGGRRLPAEGKVAEKVAEGKEERHMGELLRSRYAFVKRQTERS